MNYSEFISILNSLMGLKNEKKYSENKMNQEEISKKFNIFNKNNSLSSTNKIIYVEYKEIIQIKNNTSINRIKNI